MRRRLVALWGLLVALSIGGCGGGGGGAAADPGPEVRRTWPAAAAGGACHLLSYQTVDEAIGVMFDTAGASEKGETYTCALTRTDAAYPDLVLAVTATKMDEKIFEAALKPAGSTKVTGLGAIAYRITVAEKAPAGPAVEIGWMSANKRYMLLHYTFPPQTAAADVAEMTPKLVTLAKKVDETMV